MATVPTTHYRSIDINGVNVFYREAGASTAPTLLLLHGFPTSSHMFRDLVPRLADQFHIVAPDYPGFGASDMPGPTEFRYTFDRLADTVGAFIDALELDRYVLYMQDYGGPVGFRIATRRPKAVQGLIIQNANAYEEGLSQLFRDTVGPLWEERSGATEKPVLDLFELAGTRFQYTEGSPAPEAINPDAWIHAQAGLDRPGNRLIQLDLQADYHTNLACYDEWHRYLREHQPPTLVVWGRGDPLFTEAGAEAYRRDVTDIEVHCLDAGHFALEEQPDTIANHIRAFFAPRVDIAQEAV